MNKFLKKVINKIKKIYYCLLPKKNWIILESTPDLSDNTKAVFDEMIKRELNKKYTFIWIVSNKNKEFPQYENTIYIEKSELNYYKNRAKVLISCNDFLQSFIKGQTSFYLTHGTGIKNVGSYQLPSHIDYTLVASNDSINNMNILLGGNKKTFYGLGFPRNDELTNSKIDLHSLFSINYKKIIVWYPTFRQHKNGFKTKSNGTIPLLDDYKKAIKLNEEAKKRNILIVIKPHFAQDINYITKHNLSNIIFINDDFFKENNLSSYQFVGNCDALITDYSSIYFDYLLCDKPIGVVWEDIDEYRENPGFCIDVNYYMKGAYKIYKLEELINFIDDLNLNKDNLKKEREEICKYANYSKDGKNSQRVVDFIIEKSKL